METQQIKTNSWQRPQTSPSSSVCSPRGPHLAPQRLPPLPYQSHPPPQIRVSPLIPHTLSQRSPWRGGGGVVRKRQLSLSMSLRAGTKVPRSPSGWMCGHSQELQTLAQPGAPY